MKITDVRTILLTGPSTNDPSLEARTRRSAAYVEIHSDCGAVGLGETYAGYFVPELVPGIVDFFKPILLGQTTGDIPALWERMYQCGNFWCRVGLGTAVLTGIEAALWDLKGKLAGQPVYRLLGGAKHEKVFGYASGNNIQPRERMAAMLDLYLSLGFRGVKVGVGSHSAASGWWLPADPAEAADFEAQKVAFIRSVAGKDFKVMLDGHMGNNPCGAWTLDTAWTVLKTLEPCGLFFFEEPLHYTDPWGYAELCKSTTVPVAGGECLTGACEWRVFTERDCFDIGQPDASFTGGLGECLKVAALLEARGRSIALHAWGSGGCLMQNVHVAFACGNTAAIEVPPAYGSLHSEIMGDSFVMQDGMVLRPEHPGLGIVLTDAIKKRFPFVPGSGEFNSVPGKILKEFKESGK